MRRGVFTLSPHGLWVCLTCPSTDGRGRTNLCLPKFIFVSQLMLLLLRQLRQLRQTFRFRALLRGWAGSAGGTAETDVRRDGPARSLQAQALVHLLLPVRGCWYVVSPRSRLAISGAGWKSASRPEHVGAGPAEDFGSHGTLTSYNPHRASR
jgi:hypothetical protein